MAGVLALALVGRVRAAACALAEMDARPAPPAGRRAPGRRGRGRRPRLRRALGIQLRPRRPCPRCSATTSRPRPAGRPGGARPRAARARRPRLREGLPEDERGRPAAARRPAGARSARAARGYAAREPGPPSPVPRADRAAQARPALAADVVPRHRRHLHPVHVRGERERDPARLGDPVHGRARAGPPARLRARGRGQLRRLPRLPRASGSRLPVFRHLPRRALRAGRAGPGGPRVLRPAARRPDRAARGATSPPSRPGARATRAAWARCRSGSTTPTSKTQGQADGVRSYGRMVDLLLAERRHAPARVLTPR